MLNRCNIQSRLFVVICLTTLLGSFAAFLYLYHLAESELIADKIAALTERAATQMVTPEDLAGFGITQKEMRKFLHEPTSDTQGFISSQDGEEKLIWVKKLGAGRLSAQIESVTGPAQWLVHRGLSLVIFLLVSAGLSGVLLFTLARASLSPLRTLRRTTEDILAGKFEVPNRYRGSDEIGKMFGALEKLCVELNTTGAELEKISDLATKDGMTGLKNHRAFKEELGRQLQLAQRHDKPLGFLILDVDHFKKFNDTYGHQQGDEVLKCVAKILKTLARRTDFVARYGGEEFVLVLPETPESGVKEVAEKLRRALEETVVGRLDGNQPLKVTASFGGIGIDGNRLIPKSKAFELKDFVEVADRNLYLAKAKVETRRW